MIATPHPHAEGTEIGFGVLSFKLIQINILVVFSQVKLATKKCPAISGAFYI